jgi:AAA+ superfamily predicted ATPase
MLCFETNRPEVLDPAVQSRITQSVEFIPPGKDQLRDMMKQYVNRYIVREHCT